MSTAAIFGLILIAVELLLVAWFHGATWGMDTETPARKQALQDAYSAGYNAGITDLLDEAKELHSISAAEDDK